MNNNVYKESVKVYESLIKYKNYFPQAIKRYFDTIDDQVTSYKRDEKQISTRLKVEHEPAYYKDLFQFIFNYKQSTNKGDSKITKTQLINDILSSLQSCEQYN